MALTATVTHDAYKAVVCHLSLNSSVLVGCQPNRPNIRCAVKPLGDVEDFCSHIVHGCQTLGLEYSKTITTLLRLCSTLTHVEKKIRALHYISSTLSYVSTVLSY